MRPQIAKDATGTLVAEFPFAPDAAGTVTILRAGGTDLVDAAVSAAASVVDTLNLTTNAVSAVGIRTATVGVLTVAQAKEFVGKSVTITSTLSGFRMRNRIQTVEAVAGTLTFEIPLEFALVSGDTVVGNTHTFVVTALNTPNIEQNFRAVFTADINSVSTHIEVIYDVGLRVTENPATAGDFQKAWPDYHLSEPDEWDQVTAAPALEEGWEYVNMHVWASGNNPNRIRDIRPLYKLVINRTERHMAGFGLVPAAFVDDVEGRIERLDKDYESMFQIIMAGVQWYDDDDDGILDAGEDADALSMNQFGLSR